MIRGPFFATPGVPSGTATACVAADDVTGPVRFVFGTARFVFGTARFVFGTARFVFGTARFAFAAVRFVFGTARFAFAAARFAFGTARFALGTARFVFVLAFAFAFVFALGGVRRAWVEARFLREAGPVARGWVFAFGRGEAAVVERLPLRGAARFGAFWVDFARTPVASGGPRREGGGPSIPWKNPGERVAPGNLHA